MFMCRALPLLAVVAVLASNTAFALGPGGEHSITDEEPEEKATGSLSAARPGRHLRRESDIMAASLAADASTVRFDMPAPKRAPELGAAGPASAPKLPPSVYHSGGAAAFDEKSVHRVPGPKHPGKLHPVARQASSLTAGHHPKQPPHSLTEGATAGSNERYTPKAASVKHNPKMKAPKLQPPHSDVAPSMVQSEEVKASTVHAQEHRRAPKGPPPQHSKAAANLEYAPKALKEALTAQHHLSTPTAAKRKSVQFQPMSKTEGFSQTPGLGDAQSILQEDVSDYEAQMEKRLAPRAEPTEFTCGPDMDCQPLGCFPQRADDTAALAELEDSAYDFTCQSYTPNPGPCRSGLPFYRLATNDLTPSTCFHFCLGKGLDISGLVGGKECRCGASSRMTGVWNGKIPPMHLKFEDMLVDVVSDTHPSCKITAFNYTGDLLNGMIAHGTRGMTRADERYVATIVNQRDAWDHFAAGKHLSPPSSGMLQKSAVGHHPGSKMTSSDGQVYDSSVPQEIKGNKPQESQNETANEAAMKEETHPQVASPKPASSSSDSAGLSTAEAAKLKEKKAEEAEAEIEEAEHRNKRVQPMGLLEQQMPQQAPQPVQQQLPSGTWTYDASSTGNYQPWTQQQVWQADPASWNNAAAAAWYGQGAGNSYGAYRPSTGQQWMPAYPQSSYLELSAAPQIQGDSATHSTEDAATLGACASMTESGECTESACACGPGFVKETLLLATGGECFTCAAHCNSADRGCGVLPCRCDATKGEVPVVWNPSDLTATSADLTTGTCIKCLASEEHNGEPWKKPDAPAGASDPQNRKVTIHYLVEEASEYAVDDSRLDLVKSVLEDFGEELPCVEFKRIPWADRSTNDVIKQGAYIHILKPPASQNWCLAQNAGMRRRSTAAVATLTVKTAAELDGHLQSSSTKGWKGASLLWVGHCNSARWAPQVAQEVGKLLGMQNPVERFDATNSFSDPWSSNKHYAHIQVNWDNLVNESAKTRFTPKNQSYTGSYATGLMDAYSGYAEYDFFSIMHPDTYASSMHGLNSNKPSFETKPNGNFNKVAGSATQLSMADSMMLADLYQCNTDRLFAQQGFKQGHAITSLHYAEMSHIVSSDISSTQTWIVSKDQQKVESWIEQKMLEYKWQLSFIRYMPGSNAFTAYMDTNRWSRRRSGGAADQRYHWGTSFASFKAWVTKGHRDQYVVTDMAADGRYITSIMSKMAAVSNTQQNLFWSSNWSHCIEQIRSHAQLNPAFAITSLMEYSNWDDVGQGCCAGAPGERAANLMFLGASMTKDECKQKCQEFVNCGAIDINSTGHCSVFSWDYDCSELDHSCETGSTILWGLENTYIDAYASGDDVDVACFKDASYDQAWKGSAATAEEKCVNAGGCAGLMCVTTSGNDCYYCKSKPKLSETMVAADCTWKPRMMNETVTAHAFASEWVVAMTTNTSISAQFVKMSQTEPEAITFINQAYANNTNPGRVTALMATHWGGFATLMSVTSGDNGAPYWSPPNERLQRYAINQPYVGFI